MKINLDDLQEYLNTSIELAKAAGRRILELYKTKLDIRFKEDQTPLTLADLESHRIITDGLSEKYPSIPIISEESETQAYLKRCSWESFWLIDPIDGTKDFITNSDDFTVNIALIYKNRPIVGVIFAPAHGCLFFASEGKGAYKLEEQVVHKLSTEQEVNDPIRVCLSRSHGCEQTDDFIGSLNYDNEQIQLKKIGSSLKFCKLADGYIDLYPRLTQLKEWDIAAGDLILSESGCKIVDFERREKIFYNTEKLNCPKFIAMKKNLKL